MGFFDSLEKLFNDEPKVVEYTESELRDYFEKEIGYKQSPTTTIHEVIVGEIERIHPDACEWSIENRSAKIKKHADGTYTITYRGIIQHIFDSFGRRLDFLFYEVQVNTNTQAKLIKERSTTINVFEGEI